MDTQVDSMFGYCELDSTVLDSIVLLPHPELWPDVPLVFFSPPSWAFSLLFLLCFVFFPPLETPFVFSICHFVRATRISSRPGVSKFQDLMPNDLRWSWYNNNRHKAHNKCNALESSRNCSPLPPPLGWRKAVFCETVPWCQKSWGPRKITGFVVGADLGLNPGSAIPAVWLWAGQLTPFVSVSSYAKWEEQSLHLPW